MFYAYVCLQYQDRGSATKPSIATTTSPVIVVILQSKTQSGKTLLPCYLGHNFRPLVMKDAQWATCKSCQFLIIFKKNQFKEQYLSVFSK